METCKIIAASDLNMDSFCARKIYENFIDRMNWEQYGMFKGKFNLIRTELVSGFRKLFADTEYGTIEFFSDGSMRMKKVSKENADNALALIKELDRFVRVFYSVNSEYLYGHACRFDTAIAIVERKEFHFFK